MNSKIIVGTRGSTLALAQTHWVIKQLAAFYPRLNFEILKITTKGDLVQNKSLDKIGGKGVFVKEIEKALLDGKIDLAVHSMKDMPTSQPPGLILADVPAREDARDVLVLSKRHKSLPPNATIATGSKRRKFQLQSAYSGINIVPMRGNIETRIKKIETQGLDGIILAAAGLKRLGLQYLINCYLPMETMLPAPSQGALAIEIREDDIAIKEIVNAIKDEYATVQIAAERAFLEAIGGGCQLPVGAFCGYSGGEISLTGLYGDGEGKLLTRKTMARPCGGEPSRAEGIAKSLGLALAEAIKKEHVHER